MTNSQEKSIRDLVAQSTLSVKQLFNRSDEPQVVVSPYRFNPLGAHIDHQNGSVMARTINQYTVLAFYPADDHSVELFSDIGTGEVQQCRFDMGSTESSENWVRYAMASAYCFKTLSNQSNGLQGVLLGTLVGAGLSSSASVILAYLSAFSATNNTALTPVQLVELCRQVENEHMGLNNGIQDQMSVAFGKRSALSLLHMSDTSVTYINDPHNIDDVCWVLCYSGFSRELVSSGFNDRVSECCEAAAHLHEGAQHLGQVPESKRSSEHIAQLPQHLGNRAKHVYSEMARVAAGCDAWQAGDWQQFGQLMNESCDSSIEQYECGSEPMIALRDIARDVQGVYGARFSGGGYGGCFNMLVSRQHAEQVGNEVLERFLQRYPEKTGIARSFIASAEDNVRILSQ
jgi:galactokinase/galacturonokinase